MILVTVGSMFPFDRLVMAADALAERLGPQTTFFAQIGDGRYEPSHMPFLRFVPREKFAGLMTQAEMVISHAGIGTIAETLAFGKPLLVLPRRKSLGEHVNDHQVATAARFEALGHLLVAGSESDIEAHLGALRTFVPRRRVADTHRLARHVAAWLAPAAKQAGPQA